MEGTRKPHRPHVLRGDVADAICRNRYSPGVKKRRGPGELGEMAGTPPPVYADPTGENAAWPDEIDDLIDRKVRAMVRTIGHVRNTARWMREPVSPANDGGRERGIPQERVPSLSNRRSPWPTSQLLPALVTTAGTI